MAEKWIVGEALRLDLKFERRNNAGVLIPTDPTTVLLTFFEDGASVGYDLLDLIPVTPGPGTYYYEYALNVPGIVRWRISSTGAVVAAEQGQIVVKPAFT